MPDDARNPPVALVDCYECGDEVTARLNKNQRAYYYCDCGAHHRWNSQNSKAMKKAAAVADRTGDPPDGEIPAPTAGAELEPANDNPDGADTGSVAEPTRRRGRFGRR